MEKEGKELVLTDEEGNELNLFLYKEFKYKDKDYAILFGEDEEIDEDEEISQDVYILEVVKTDGKEEYLEIEDDELMDALIQHVETIIYEDEIPA